MSTIAHAKAWFYTHRKNILLHSVLLVLQCINAFHLICMRYGTQYIHPLVYGAIRILLAVPIIVISAYPPKQEKVLPKGRKLWMMIFILCLFGVVINQLLVVSAMKFSTATTASILLPTIPTVTLTVAIILRQETFGWMKLLAIVLACIGVAALSGIDKLAQFSDPKVLIGSLMLVANYASFAVYLVLQKGVIKDFPRGTVLTAWVILMGGIIILFFSCVMILSGVVELPTDVPLQAWGAVAFSGVIATGVFMMGTTWAVKNTSVSLVSIYGTCQAVIGTFFAWIVLGEQLEWMQIIGAPFIFCALLLSVREQYMKEKRERGTEYQTVGADESLEKTTSNIEMESSHKAEESETSL